MSLKFWKNFLPTRQSIGRNKCKVAEFLYFPFTFRAVKFPPPCSNRDVVQHIKIKVDGDATMILYKHTTHPAMPEQPGIVRYIS